MAPGIMIFVNIMIIGLPTYSSFIKSAGRTAIIEIRQKTITLKIVDFKDSRVVVSCVGVPILWKYSEIYIATGIVRYAHPLRQAF